MNDDLEYELRAALRRKEPSRDLLPRPKAHAWRFAVAASVLAALAAPAGVVEYRTRQQRHAKDQLVFAFHLAASKLDVAQQKLRTAK